MLSKRERLTQKEFNRHFASGRRIHTPLFTAIHNTHDTLHVSVVVPKKVAKSAVKRNQLRRRIYDVVRRYARDAGVTGVYIFLVKKPALTASFRELKEVVENVVE